MTSTIQLRLCLSLGWSEIDTIRRAVAVCLEAAFGSVELGDSLSMVSAELLENAVKYGKSGGLIGFVLEEIPDGLRIVVTNPIDDSTHGDKLVERLAWLDKFTDTRSMYAAALERAFNDACAGGLGLARIAHEGGCSLHCDTSVAGIVTVSARSRRHATRALSGARASA